jgi:triphosphatase
VALKSSRVRAVMLDLTQWLTVGDWSTADATRAVREAPAREFAAAALRKRRKALKIDAPSLALLTDDERHAIRKDAKTLRYATEFFADLFVDAVQQKRQAKFVSTLETLQDRLGTLNDAATVPAILVRLGLEDTEAALVDDRKHAKRLDRAAAAHSALLDRKAFWR